MKSSEAVCSQEALFSSKRQTDSVSSHAQDKASAEDEDKLQKIEAAISSLSEKILDIETKFGLMNSALASERQESAADRIVREIKNRLNELFEQSESRTSRVEAALLKIEAFDADTISKLLLEFLEDRRSEVATESSATLDEVKLILDDFLANASSIHRNNEEILSKFNISHLESAISSFHHQLGEKVDLHLKEIREEAASFADRTACISEQNSLLQTSLIEISKTLEQVKQSCDANAHAPSFSDHRASLGRFEAASAAFLRRLECSVASLAAESIRMERVANSVLEKFEKTER